MKSQRTLEQQVETARLHRKAFVALVKKHKRREDYLRNGIREILDQRQDTPMMMLAGQLVGLLDGVEKVTAKAGPVRRRR